jgi:putative tricarboxylic transport membrane protein
METFSGVLGAIAAMDLQLWLMLVFGIVLGLIVGVLPGLTFVMGVLLILPFTYSMEPAAGIVLMLAAYVAGTYGGALTSILLHVPGEPNNVPLLWDGWQMNRRGQAAQALGWTAVAALGGGLFSWLVLTFAAEPFARVALSFSSTEYFLIVLLGLTSVLALTGTSVVKALIALLAGMLLATIGVDEVFAAVRFDFGTTILRDGVDYLAVMIGIYALGDVLKRYGEQFAGANPEQPDTFKTAIPGFRAIRERLGSLTRGTAVGAAMGTVPGAGATVGSFVAYGLEKQFGKFRKDVGNGSPNGVIAPQAASTATVGTALVPMLVLGIPGSAATAVILGALLLHNIQPGPQIFTTQPELVYTIMGTLLIGLILMFILGISTVKPMIRMLKIPEVYVGTFIVLFAFVGAYALRQSMSDVWIMTGSAVIGLLMMRGGYPLAPLVLGAILGPLAETHLQTALISSAGDWSVFVTRPISLALTILWVLVLVLMVWKTVQQSRAQRAVERDQAGSGVSL